jgi:hypothetical protein
MLRALMVLLGAISFAARAAALEPEPPLGSLGVDSLATRYGTSYETVYLLSLEPRAALRLGSLELSALLPLSTSATYPTFCCRLSLGNATLAARLSQQGSALRHWYELGLSLPSSHWSDAHASSLAATAALLRDAGHYLPDTTTLRAGLGAELDVTPWLALGAAGGAHYWLRKGGATDPLILPLDATATLRWGQAWSARAGYRALLRLLTTKAEEQLLSELSGAVAYTWPGSRLEASLSVPVDASLRELGMLGVGTRYVRSF